MGFSPELGCVLIWDEGGELEGGRGDFNHSCRFKDTYQSLLTRRGDERRKGGEREEEEEEEKKPYHQHRTEQLSSRTDRSGFIARRAVEKRNSTLSQLE